MRVSLQNFCRKSSQIPFFLEKGYFLAPSILAHLQHFWKIPRRMDKLLSICLPSLTCHLRSTASDCGSEL